MNRVNYPFFGLLFLTGWCAAQGPVTQKTSIEVVDVTPVHDRMICVHLKEGTVKHHTRGQKRTQEQVFIDPLKVDPAMKSSSYMVTSVKGKNGDASFTNGLTPVSVGRKSKGTDFAWFVDSWENGKAVNRRPDHIKEHWIYLTLPQGMKEGFRYSVDAPSVFGKSEKVNFTFGTDRSESLHVNLLGYVPTAPQKFGYLYHWAGDLGGIDFARYENRQFSLINDAGKEVFSGKVNFRMPKTQQETFHVSDSKPYGNFLNADVYECDFSSFKAPGSYRLKVNGVGTSFPFRIESDVYKDAFYHTARALYHNRSGIELLPKYTKFTRPAPQNPLLTPGFKGKLQYSTIRNIDWENGDGGGKSVEAIKKSLVGPLDAWGWYQDAGDWDGYESHLRVAQELILAYMIAPKNFVDKQLNIPESGNGVPDILDEAAWLPRFCHRLRKELIQKKYGTGGVALRVCPDIFGGEAEGEASYDDKRTWIVAAEDPVSTFRYAGVAAQLAEVLKGKDPEGVDWKKEAIESYRWAIANTKGGDESKVKDNRMYAASALVRLTGDETYFNQFKKDSSGLSEKSIIGYDSHFGPLIFAMPGGVPRKDLEYLGKIKKAILATADERGINTPKKRALRWAGDYSFPMLIGQQTTPWAIEIAAAYAIVKDEDPKKATEYRTALFNNADYFMGTNALNSTWITGVGARFPTQIFHIDAWYNGKGEYQPGLIPYSPWRKESGNPNGPWSQEWAHLTVYPGIDAWPGNEQWFSNRCSPMGSEFTVHQNIAPAAAMYGILCGEKL